MIPTDAIVPKTHGDGDPSISPEVQAAHDAAMAQNQRTYRDPHTGGLVVTAHSLRLQDTCCGNGCRHCPYPAHMQRASGRGSIRDE